MVFVGTKERPFKLPAVESEHFACRIHLKSCNMCLEVQSLYDIKKPYTVTVVYDIVVTLLQTCWTRWFHLPYTRL